MLLGRILQSYCSAPLLQVAEFVDERPEEVKQMEAFRSSAKWKLLGGECQQQII